MDADGKSDLAAAPGRSALLDAALAWAADDPAPEDRAAVESLVAAAEAGDDDAATALASWFAGPLEFGTAGLRGPERPGPAGMNTAVVRRAAAGVASWLGGGATVVVGRDGRRGSAVFAQDLARVLTGAGLRVLVLPGALPTPLLAFAVRHLGADAGLMVTASHNPPQDNGLKVYDRSGAQVVAPDDATVALAMASVESVAALPLGPDGETVDVLDAYLAAVVGLLDPVGPRALRVAYTPLHGVGGALLPAALERAGFPAPVVVPQQALPDPAFPTVPFPNPEEPGALDLLLELAASSGADLAIANDPDADRVAVAVPVDGGWRALSGDETGALLGEWVLTHGQGADRLVATTIVSSRLLGRLAEATGVRYAETLTGFKWLARAGDGLVYAYEEALGHCVAGPVHDKDGVSAALVLCELAAWARSVDRPLPVLLDMLAVRFGVHATRPWSVRVADLSVRGAVVARLLAAPPAALGGLPVVLVEDLSLGAGGLPPTEGVRLWAGAAREVRVVVRPSGTEPKLKAYLEVVEDVDPVDPAAPAADVAAARARAEQRLDGVLADLRGAAGL